MNCFLHGNSSAVAVCKTCGKGVCSVCAIDKGVAVTCSDTCANEAAVLHEMNQRGKKIYGLTGAKSSLPSGVIVWTLFCLFFIGLQYSGTLRTTRSSPSSSDLGCFAA